MDDSLDKDGRGHGRGGAVAVPLPDEVVFAVSVAEEGGVNVAHAGRVHQRRAEVAKGSGGRGARGHAHAQGTIVVAGGGGRGRDVRG